MSKEKYIYEDIHSEDLQEIIAKPPSWLLQRGISFVLMTVLLILGLSFFIKYPETVHTNMKFTTTNAPKVIITQGNGVLTRLLANDGDWVEKNHEIAYLESTADHEQVIGLLEDLKEIRNKAVTLKDLEDIIPPNNLRIGELQGNYQAFYLSYLNYRAINAGGIFQKRKAALMNEVVYVNEQNSRTVELYELQKKELELAEAEFEKFKQLAEKKIISPLELQQKEAVLLSKRQAIPQMESNLISNRSNLLSKNREISEVDNQVLEEEKKFVQALNSFISEAENWKKQHVLSAPVSGKLIYAGFWQENQYIPAGEELFYINPGKDDYYGETFIPQVNISKVMVNQDVLVKVRSYPHQEYGYLRGKVSYISDIPIRDTVFFAKVTLIRNEKDSLIKLKPGILADAEIITADQSIFKRIWMNLTKSF